MNDHDASVVVNDDGGLNFIHGLPSRKLVSVLPNPTDTVVRIDEYPHHFSRLTSINISLTNTCNLSCSYCYEQHRKDYGRFTVDSIKRVHDFLVNINNNQEKTIIFFGGEPLIHSKLILDFLRTYKDEIKTRVSMVTNGLLLTPDFILEYFSYPFTSLIWSIDTFDHTIDDRGIGEKRMDAVKASILSIPSEIRETRLVIRPTIGFRVAQNITEFLQTAYDMGVRSYILQPLIMGNREGFLQWSDGDWERLTANIGSFFTTHPDVHLEVTEGVGDRTMGSNCLVGYDIISVDPSGDFSGCFFFVNQKDKAGDLISGNIFSGSLYVNRENSFKAEYQAMFDQHEQCRSCNLQNHCYQCPAGNLDTGGGMFRPDGMCKKFVQFYLDILNLKFRVRWDRNLSKLTAEYNVRSERALQNIVSDMMSSFGKEYQSDRFREYPLGKMRQIWFNLLRGERPYTAVLLENQNVSWNDIHSLLLKKHKMRTVMMPQGDGTIVHTIMALALLKTAFFDGDM